MSMTVSSILAWFRQPSTVTGMSALAAAATGVVGGQMTPGTAVPVLAFGLVAMLLPDNSAAQADIRNLIADAADLVKSGGSSAHVAPVAGDVVTLTGDLSPVAPVAPAHPAS